MTMLAVSTVPHSTSETQAIASTETCNYPSWVIVFSLHSRSARAKAGTRWKRPSRNKESDLQGVGCSGENTTRSVV